MVISCCVEAGRSPQERPSASWPSFGCKPVVGFSCGSFQLHPCAAGYFFHVAVKVELMSWDNAPWKCSCGVRGLLSSTSVLLWEHSSLEEASPVSGSGWKLGIMSPGLLIFMEVCFGCKLVLEWSRFKLFVGRNRVRLFMGRSRLKEGELKQQ